MKTDIKLNVESMMSSEDNNLKVLAYNIISENIEQFSIKELDYFKRLSLLNFVGVIEVNSKERLLFTEIQVLMDEKRIKERQYREKNKIKQMLESTDSNIVILGNVLLEQYIMTYTDTEVFYLEDFIRRLMIFEFKQGRSGELYKQSYGIINEYKNQRLRYKQWIKNLK